MALLARETFREFDPGPGGIDQKGDLQPDAWNVPKRALEGDAVGCEFLAERLEVLHLETDVIERATLRRGLRHIRLTETEADAGHAGRVRIRRRRQRRAEVLHVPGAECVDVGRVKVRVKMLHGHGKCWR